MLPLANVVKHTLAPRPVLSLAADLLLLLWPVFFVAATRQDPHLKVRNFKKSVTRGSQRMVDFSEPVRVSLSSRRHRELAKRAGQNSAACTGEESPAWDSVDEFPLEQVTALVIVKIFMFALSRIYALSLPAVARKGIRTDHPRKHINSA